MELCMRMEMFHMFILCVGYILYKLKKLSISIKLLKKTTDENSVTFQWLRFNASTAGGTGSIPGQGTKISHGPAKLN